MTTVPPDPVPPTELPAAAHAKLVAGFASGLTLPLSFRIAQLKALRAFLCDFEQLHLDALRADLHKSRLEALLYDFLPTSYDISYLLPRLRRLAKPRVVSRETGAPIRVEKHPKGVVLIFGPFNFPVQLVLRPLVAAIAAGNAVCIKPSELAPACEAFLVRLAAVLDPRVFAVVTGGPQVCGELLEFRWDHIMFTGSGHVGRIVMAAAAKHLTPVTLELGGKCPAIVTSSAHISTAAGSIAKARFLNCGQICLASDYCLVNESVYDEFVKALLAKIREFYTDDPKTCDHYGRLISSRHFEHVTGLLHDSKGKVLTGGEFDDADQHYVAPTVVAVESEEDSLMRDEIFGPILPVMRVKSTDEAIAFVNKRQQPLALYLFCRDREETQQVVSRTRSGSVGVNETIMQISTPGSFMGGVGESGMGAYGFATGFDTFSHTRPVLYSRPMWAKLLDILGPKNFGKKDGKERKGLERIARIFGRIPFPNSGGEPLHDKIFGWFGRLTAAVAVVAALVAGRRTTSK